MAKHSAADHNYVNTFIAVATDSTATVAKIPVPRGGKPTVATRQYDMLADHPFTHRQEDVLFDVWLARQDDLVDLAPDELEQIREDFFATGQPCLRASPLTKTHGWGVAFDAEGRAALCAVESEEYADYLARPDLRILTAMRTKRA